VTPYGIIFDPAPVGRRGGGEGIDFRPCCSKVASERDQFPKETNVKKVRFTVAQVTALCGGSLPEADGFA